VCGRRDVTSRARSASLPTCTRLYTVTHACTRAAVLLPAARPRLRQRRSPPGMLVQVQLAFSSENVTDAITSHTHTNRLHHVRSRTLYPQPPPPVVVYCCCAAMTDRRRRAGAVPPRGPGPDLSGRRRHRALPAQAGARAYAAVGHGGDVAWHMYWEAGARACGRPLPQPCTRAQHLLPHTPHAVVHAPQPLANHIAHATALRCAARHAALLRTTVTAGPRRRPRQPGFWRVPRHRGGVRGAAAQGAQERTSGPGGHRRRLCAGEADRPGKRVH
jgi:hypothetical protein